MEQEENEIEVKDNQNESDGTTEYHGSINGKSFTAYKDERECIVRASLPGVFLSPEEEKAVRDELTNN